jgi:hypothetical protein
MAPPQLTRSLMLTSTLTKSTLAGRASKTLDGPPFQLTNTTGREKKMIGRNAILKTTSMLLAGVLASGMLVLRAGAQSPAPAGRPAQADKPATTAVRSHYRPNRFAGRAGEYYRLIWGIDSLSVRWTESGEVIKFTFRVLDADKAKPLNDKKLEPSLIDETAHVKLVVPMVDKVGLLRQTSDPEVGKTYWMVFSNKGGYVKRGDRVSILIGKFRADGLVVD